MLNVRGDFFTKKKGSRCMKRHKILCYLGAKRCSEEMETIHIFSVFVKLRKRKSRMWKVWKAKETEKWKGNV